MSIQTLRLDMLGRWLARLEEVSRWLRPGASPDVAMGVMYLTGLVALDFPTSILGFVALVITGDWPLAVALVVIYPLQLAALLALRHPRTRYPAVARAELLFMMALLVLMTLETEAWRPEQLYWLGVVPISATLTLGRRGAVEGVLMAGLAAGFAALLRWRGFHLHRPEPDAVTYAVVLLQFFVTLAVIAVVFETVRLRHAQEAERASKARSMFLANVSHELRPPMNGVIGLSELLSAGRLEPGQREQLALLRRSGESMVALVNDLLDLTKLESGHFTLEHAPVSVAALVGDVASLSGAAAVARAVRLEPTVDASVPPWLEGDPLRLRQVLLNLVGNAVKFTEHGGAVAVQASWTEGWLEFTVIDHGIGMSPEVVAHLFRPFHQADESTTRRFGGTGLGLAITAQLVQLMSGEVRVESTPGVGSTFRARVRAAQCAAPPVSHAPELRSTATPYAGTVLVVEDNPINQVVARGLCERLGFQVEVVENGQLAVEAVAARPYRVVLMDCQMPVMDGYQATRRIRELPGPTRHVPIIALTASAYREELDTCLAAGMDDTLTKPLTSAALRATLDRLSTRGDSPDVVRTG